MSGRKAKATRRTQAVAAQAPAQQWFSWRSIGLATGVVAVVIVAIVLVGRRDSGSSSPPATDRGASGTPFAVGAPGPGRLAPAINLPSTSGSTFDLASYRGKQQVLLYFQEGLTCQPCWDQIAAIEQQLPAFRALGIGPIVSVTTDRLDLIQQKARDEGFSMPVLSDPDARVSDAYDARTYSMTWMKPPRDGHSFILVGKDGRIRWRADYGGPPRYTMFLPVDRLLADLRQGDRQTGMTEVTIVTTEDCAFCEQAKQVLERVAADAHVAVRDVPLDSPEGRQIAATIAAPFPPVVLLDGDAFSYGRLSERRLRKALAGRVGTAP